MYSLSKREAFHVWSIVLAKNHHWQRVSRRTCSLKKFTPFAMVFLAFPFANIWQSCFSAHIKGHLHLEKSPISLFKSSHCPPLASSPKYRLGKIICFMRVRHFLIPKILKSVPFLVSASFLMQ